MSAQLLPKAARELIEKQRKMIRNMGGITMICGCFYGADCKLVRSCPEHAPKPIRGTYTTLYAFTYLRDGIGRVYKFFPSRVKAERARRDYNVAGQVQVFSVPMDRTQLCDMLSQMCAGDL